MNWAMVVPKVKLLLLCSLVFWKACECAPLETTIMQERSGNPRSGNTSCVGDTLTYTCTVAAIAHRWTIPSLGLSVSITRGDPTFSDSQFAIVTTADRGGANPITTVLTVTSSAALNGAFINCSDANQVSTEEQETTAMVFDSPSAPPGLTVVARGNVSYDFTINPPIIPPSPIIPSSPYECVLNYIITATSSDGSRNITVPASEVDDSTPVNEAGFDVCTVMYSFTVAPVTSQGIGPNSASVDQGPSNITGVSPTVDPLHVMGIEQNSPTVYVRVSWEIAESAGLIVEIGRERDDSVCGDYSRFDRNESQALLGLVCSEYAEESVTVCVRYIDDGCPSMETLVNTTVNVTRDLCAPTTPPPPETTTTDGTPTLDNNTGGSIIGPAIGGVVGGVAAVAVVIIIIILIMVLYKKKGKGSGGDGMDSGKTKLTYHSAGATAAATSGGVTSGGVTSVELSHVDSGAMYADPKAIEHQQTSTGDEYAMVSSNTKAKKKAPSRPPVAAMETGDLYSVPDKTKKIQNEGLVYADIDVANPQRPPPRSHVIQPQQIDNESVTYATVATV